MPNKLLLLGAGRRRTKFLPTQLSGLALWLAADRIAAASGGTAFLSASSQYLSVADNTQLSVQNIDFALCAWVKLTTKTTTQVIASKYDTSNQRNYMVYYDTASDRFKFIVSPDGIIAPATATADALGAVSVGIWYFVVCWHDAVGDTINIQINNGTTNSVAHSTGVHDGTAPFALGVNFVTGAASNFLNGEIDEVAFWKRNLTAAEKIALYNNGNGISYEQTDAAMRVDLQAWWKLNEQSGNRVDSHNGIILAATNAPLGSAGKVSVAPVNNDPIALWNDLSSNAYNAVQATAAARPTYKTNIQNSLPIVRFDAIDDFMQVADASDLDGGAGMTIFIVTKQNPLAINNALLAKANYSADWSWGFQTHNTLNDEAEFYVASSVSASGSDYGATTNLNRSNTEFSIIDIIYDGTQINANRIKFWKDGIAIAVSITGAIAATLQNSGSILNIGKFGGSLSRFFGGDIAEIGIYSRAISILERQRLDKYLGQKYGITVA
jgi:hypothetical protein